MAAYPSEDPEECDSLATLCHCCCQAKEPALFLPSLVDAGDSQRSEAESANDVRTESTAVHSVRNKYAVEKMIAYELQAA